MLSVKLFVFHKGQFLPNNLVQVAYGRMIPAALPPR
jgi:hypothetical protein